jgi:DNA repair protein RadD
MLTLRQYQEEALRELFVFWRNGGGNPLIAMATGTGKSIVIAFLIKQLLTDYSKMRVLVTAPNRELLEQGIRELQTIWPDAPIGINCDGLRLPRHRCANSFRYSQFDLSQSRCNRRATPGHHR